MFVIVVSWLLVIIMVAFFITGLHEKITIINWPLTVSICFRILILHVFTFSKNCPLLAICIFKVHLEFLLTICLKN